MGNESKHDLNQFIKKLQYHGAIQLSLIHI